MSTDEYSQDLPEEDVYGMQGPSSMAYHNGSSMMMPGSNMDMSIMSTSQQQMGQQLQQDQRQKRKYTRRKQPEERKKRGPRTKDLNAPRMPLNGYVRFLNANRERIKQDYPELSFAEVTKRLASEWSSMSAEEKKVYLDEAEKAKEMYMKELHEYHQTESYQEFLSMKQRAKQQQSNAVPAVNTMAQSSASSSSAQMPPAGSMYNSGAQSAYYGEPQGMHPSHQYQAMFQQQMQHQQQQQHHHQPNHHQQNQQYSSYGMNNESKMSMQQQQQQQCMSASLNGLYGQQPPQHQQPHQHQQHQHQHHQHQQHQSQYYQPSSHSSGTSEYGGMSCSGQYPATHFHYGSNCPPHNGMSMQPMSVAPNNGSMADMNGQHVLNHRGTAPGTSTMTAILEKSGPVMDLPIFTEEFLDHNKLRDVELRNSRARLLELEEENAILSKHVEDVTTAAEKLVQNEAKEREIGSQLDSVWEKLQSNLVEHFQDITMPFSDDSQNFNSQCFPPSIDNFDQYVDEFDKFRMEALGNGPEHCVTEPRYEQHVQSLETAVKALDAVTF